MILSVNNVNMILSVSVNSVSIILSGNVNNVSVILPVSELKWKHSIIKFYEAQSIGHRTFLH